MHIGSLLFPDVDQLDLTGPFEVFARVPNASYRIYAKTAGIIRDARGLGLVADATLAEAPQLDVLHIPGGPGQEALMEDAETLNWIRAQAAGARVVFSVCTGALILGAAGLLERRRATTHWAARHILEHFGAQLVDERVVVDDNFVFASGITAGIDGALVVASLIAGDEIAERIQLTMEYAPAPPFDGGTPETARPAVLEAAKQQLAPITRRREATAVRLTQGARDRL